MEFRELSEFQKDLKQLLKRFKTLRDDLETLKKVLAATDITHPQPPMSFRIPGLGFDLPPIIKIKRFSCRSLKGKGANTGLRVIYAYYEQDQIIEFIELYYKADQENEDKQRISKHFRSRGKEGTRGP